MHSQGSTAASKVLTSFAGFSAGGLRTLRSSWSFTVPRSIRTSVMRTCRGRRRAWPGAVITELLDFVLLEKGRAFESNAEFQEQTQIRIWRLLPPWLQASMA